MKKTLSLYTYAILLGSLVNSASAQLISEFEPNPAGGDPATTTVEISGGSAFTNFDLWFLSIENDGFNGTVDRASNVTGSYDANGLAVFTVPDLENPSNTVILTDSFTGSIGDDLDAGNNGTFDTSTLGTIFDALGVSDSTSDDTSLYGSILGGTDILFNGEFEPLSVFRDSVTGEWYNTVTVDFGSANERIGVFNASGSEVNSSLFNIDPTSNITTYNDVNPTIVPEPSTYALLAGLATLGFVAIRRRK